MPGKFLLDTNIVVALFNGDESVKAKMEEAREVYLCPFVLGELLFGARKSGRIEANLRRAEEFEAENTTLSCDAETAYYFALVKDQLRILGRPIPENDVWIAAIALQNDLTLVTRDAHFGAVAILKTESW